MDVAPRPPQRQQQRRVLEENQNARRAAPKRPPAQDSSRLVMQHVDAQIRSMEDRLDSQHGLLRDEIEAILLLARKSGGPGITQGWSPETADLKTQIGLLRDTVVRLVPGGENAARNAIESNQPLLADRTYVHEQVGRAVSDVGSKFHLAKLEMKREQSSFVAEHRDDMQRLEQTIQTRIDSATVQVSPACKLPGGTTSDR